MERHMETKKAIFPEKSTHHNQKDKEKRDEKKRERKEIKLNNPRCPVLLDNCTSTYIFIFSFLRWRRIGPIGNHVAERKRLILYRLWKNKNICQGNQTKTIFSCLLEKKKEKKRGLLLLGSDKPFRRIH